MKTIAEQIADLEATRAAKAARAEEVMQKSMEENRSTDEAESEEFDTLNDEIEAIDKDLARLHALEKLQSKKAVAAEGDNKGNASESRGGVSVRNTQKLAPGIEFARYAMCLLSAKGNLQIASTIAQNRFPENERINTVLKEAVEAGTTTDPTWAGNLVAHNDLTTDFIEFLRPRTIIGQFGMNGVPALRRIPFNVHIKGQTAAGAANWVGEGYAKPVTKSGYSDVYLGWAKVAGISVITEELARFSNPGAETLVRDDLAKAVIERIDTDLVDPAKVAGTGATASPASLTNGITPVPATDDPTCDIANLWAVADATNLPASSAVYITDSRTARRLSLFKEPLGTRTFPNLTMTGGNIDGVPVIVSNYVPSDSNGSLFILVFAEEIFLADDNVVTLDASREASILMDDAAAEAMDSGTPTPSNMVSMYQTNSIALRAERYINWARRRAQAVAYLSGVAWESCGS